MKGILNWFACATVLLALLGNKQGTISSISTIILLRGVAFLAVKVTETLNKNASQIIDMAGWSACGTNIVKLIIFATSGLTKVNHFVENVGSIFS